MNGSPVALVLAWLAPVVLLIVVAIRFVQKRRRRKSARESRARRGRDGSRLSEAPPGDG